ncbi:acetolactate synthase 3 large subunit [Aeromonas simiae]|uniref:acetolactate synthase 3 large subunit n=1 Tax=Aeromonas simiae TaxID=218936 RepID=UPI0005A98BDF|nr:acetolactate synthase 3 large subunit [Aeromonas simiae]MDO2948456.1 acetolactate synthase 3 large subunit [Aeromonas simiae]MDO2951877.1 acetolactate synthase 3 large subunit [Aeromonas simiae]MDO2955839.1 acetolactate synthase 3 large subunit [Aeromonas simiae]
MEMLSGAQMVVRALEDQGVEHIFGYPGGSVLDIYDALFENSKIEHVLVRHEQAAVHMADGYARSTGQVGTVLVTSGPGATNCITGIATAYMDSIPLVILSGQVPTSMIGEDAFQETDMIGISRPVVKHSFLCKTASEIPEAIKKAYYIAASGRPGPVVVDLPKDVQNPKEKFPYHYPESVSLRSYNPTKAGHKGQIKRAAKALAEATRPVMYVGGGAIAANANGLVTQLAERFNLPVTTTLMGLGAFPGTHPQSIGMLGMHGTFEANKTMHHSDLILAVGARFDDRVTNNVAKFCPQATVVHIDIDPTSISKTVQAHIPIVGSVETVLEQMLEAIAENGFDNDKQALGEWWSQINQWRERNCLSYQRSDNMIKPQQVIETLYKVTKGEAFVASDVGQHQMFAALYYPFAKPRQWINSGGLGTMGFGLPAAMGVQFANPDAVVCCVTGDGSVQMNIQELSTCLQYGVPVKIISINNRALGMVKQWQKMFYGGRHSHSYMESLPDFVKLAEAYGHVGIAVSDPAELESAMERAFAMKDRLVFMDISVDPDEHVYPMQIKFGAMDEMWLSKTERT